MAASAAVGLLTSFSRMSYRIQVDPEAGQVLRTLRAHVVQHLGHLLAEVADLFSTGQGAPALAVARSGDGQVALLEVDDYVLCYEVNRAEQTVNVRSVQPRPRAPATSPA
jgi:mRNA-degrading endonuclease RelE of RelBE toxin-antitoxin system